MDLVRTTVIGVDRMTSEVYIVGSLFEEAAVDEASEASLRYLVLPSTIAAIGIAILMLRRWQSSLLVFILAGFSQACSVALVFLHRWGVQRGNDCTSYADFHADPVLFGSLGKLL